MDEPAEEQWPPPPLIPPARPNPFGFPSSIFDPLYAPMLTPREAWHRTRIARVGFVLLGAGAICGFALIVLNFVGVR